MHGKTYSSNYTRFVLIALTVVYVFNFIDRQILVILQESIKEDLDLSDTQLGLLTGLAFALFYVTVGLPIARWADRGNRRNIISIALTVWSAMTAISGLAQNFVQLLLARIGVGVGEAGCSPPAHSMISDYFPKEKRATALSIYSTGIYIGVLLGYLAGGWLDEFFGWRNALIILGVPGVIYAIAFYFFVEEPPRGYADGVSTSNLEVPGLFETIKMLVYKRAFVYLSLGCGMNAFVLYGVGNWQPSFLARLHEMDSGEIGTWLALTVGIGGVLGVWLGGYLSDKLGKKDIRWYMWIPVITLALSLPVTLTFVFSETTWLVLLCIGFSKVLWTTYLGPSIAMAHSLVGLRMRAMSSAVLFLVLNLVGLGMGPLFFGALSDLFQSNLGHESLRYSLGFALLFTLLAGILFWKASIHLQRDLQPLSE